MAYFPFMVDVENQTCLIVGGGPIAFRKALTIASYGARIRMVALAFSRELSELEQLSIQCIQKPFEEEDLEGVDFVIVATNLPELNHRIAGISKERRLPVNVVDVKEECSFIFPAVLRQEDITIAVSTGGACPAATKRIKNLIAETIPAYFSVIVGAFKNQREMIKSRLDTEEARIELFNTLCEWATENKELLTKEQVNHAIIEYLNREQER